MSLTLTSPSYGTQKTSLKKRVYRNKVTDWFVATSSQQAYQLWRRYMLKDVGEDPDEFDDCPDVIVFYALKDNEKLTLVDDTTGERITKKAREWAQECSLGFLASTEW